jgi:hypothetical protein
MGQAKQRGTFEERKESAIKRDEEFKKQLSQHLKEMLAVKEFEKEQVKKDIAQYQHEVLGISPLEITTQ